MQTVDFYKILGVNHKFSPEELKKKYRLLAKKYHPDANSGSQKSEELFKKISVAYETLRDETKRREYDRKRVQRAQKRSSGPRRNPGAKKQHDYHGYDFSDFQTPRDDGEPFRSQSFDQEYTPDSDAPTRGFDLHLMVNVPFHTIILGGQIPFQYEKYINCVECVGTGSASGSNCPFCDGKRQIVQQVSISVNIPPSIPDQYTLRLELLGGEGKNGAPPGDLLLKVCTEPHPQFKRKGTDVISEVKISSLLAQTGGKLEIETLDSKETVQLEEETLTGEEKRIPGKGAAIQWDKRNRGDFIIRFLVTDIRNE
tara:strand:- start:741 stop:1676 length:936 start_codon:yes stop_codon:yes gene_type:complete